MLLKKLDIIKHYLNLFLAKKFIEASKTSYFSAIFLIKKSCDKI